MNKLFFLITAALVQISSFGYAVDLLQPSCDLDLYSLGKGISTPLHQEVEWILKVKGYRVQQKDASEFDSRLLQPLQMFGSYKAGNDSLTGGADCLIEKFSGGIGERFTCSYELNLVTVNSFGQLISFAEVRASVAQAGRSEEFYSSIRDQLLKLPSCGSAFSLELGR